MPHFNEEERVTVTFEANGNSGDQNDSPQLPSQGVVAEAEKPMLKRPPMYQVVLLNDDYTPMEFVVSIIELFFYLDRELAVRIMLKVHTEGRAVCGVFPRDVAETKMTQVNQFSRENEHPLMCEIEPANESD